MSELEGGKAEECGLFLLVFTADLDLNVHTIKARGECQESHQISTIKDDSVGFTPVCPFLTQQHSCLE